MARKDMVTMYCETCMASVTMARSEWTGMCPNKPHLITYRRCNRCGYEWEARYPERLAANCIKCKSPYWNKERVML